MTKRRSARNQGRGWARARFAFERVVHDLGLPAPTIGWVSKLGSGLSCSGWAATVETQADGWPRDLVALVPRDKPEAAGVRNMEREARLLRHIEQLELPFRVPRFATAVRDGDTSILVTEFASGWPHDWRERKGTGTSPWEIVSGVAVAVHHIPVGNLDWLGGHATRHAHAEACLSKLEALNPLKTCNEPSVEKSFAWLHQNLPPADPACLVHGDLLGQNLLQPLVGLPVLIDWEYACLGDPAYDLAILTRGFRRPFQVANGFDKLLKAYREQGGIKLQSTDVRFHEIALQLKWVSDALLDVPGAEPLAVPLARLKRLLATP